MSIKEWYTSQTPREQFIVASVGLVGIGALVYLFAYEPLKNGISERQASVQAKQADLAWMQQQKPVTAVANGSARKPLDKAPYLLLDEAIKRAKISTPERVTPDGSQGARAQFSKVEFNKLLQVLGGLEQTYGISVKTINLSRKDVGQVSARLSLETLQ